MQLTDHVKEEVCHLVCCIMGREGTQMSSFRETVYDDQDEGVSL